MTVGSRAAAAVKSVVRKGGRRLPPAVRRRLRRGGGGGAVPRAGAEVPVIQMITVVGAWPPAAVVFPEPYVFYPDDVDQRVVALDPYSDQRPIVLPAVLVNDMPEGGIRPGGLMEAASGALVVESVKRLAHVMKNPERYQHPATTVSRDGLGSTIVAPMRIGNYFHWVIDMLPRLYALESAGDDLELVCPPQLPRYAEELLERTVPKGFTIHRSPVDSLVRYDAARLSPFTTVWAKGLLRPEIAEWLRPRVLGRPVGRRGPARRLYVSRAATRWHRPANEDAILAALAPYGVEPVRSEDLSVAQQLDMFADAELIVGVHGAGLANMLVADRAAVVELSPTGKDSRLQLAYWSLARTCGHRFVVVPHAAGRHVKEFPVDVDRLVAAVDFAVGASANDPMAAVV